MFLYLPMIFEYLNLIFKVKPEQNAPLVVNVARSGFTLKERKFLYHRFRCSKEQSPLIETVLLSTHNICFG